MTRVAVVALALCACVQIEDRSDTRKKADSALAYPVDTSTSPISDKSLRPQEGADVGLPVRGPVPTAVAPYVDTIPMLAVVDSSPAARASESDLAVLRVELASPVAGVPVSALRDTYAEPRGGTRPHEAMDIAAVRGTPVLSAASGRVLKLFDSKAGGLMVYAADSSQRFILMYGHLDAYAPGLAEGQPLRQGQQIGLVGTTGNAASTAPHLHFAIARATDVKQWWKGSPVNPFPLFVPTASTH